MRTDGQTIRGNEMALPHADLESVKAWAKATFTKGRIADVVVCTSTIGVLGMVLHMLHRTLESCAIVGTPPF
jgi:hypothetical protein